MKWGQSGQLLLGMSCLFQISAIGANAVQSSDIAESRVSRFLPQTGPYSRIHQSEHFEVLSSASDGVVRELLNRLEAAYGRVNRFCQAMNWTMPRNDTRMGVVYFHDYDRFDDFRSKFANEYGNASAFYLPVEDVAVYCDPWVDPAVIEVREIFSGAGGCEGLLSEEGIVRIRGELLEQLAQFENVVRSGYETSVRHEAAHQVLYHFGVHKRAAQNPDWLTEGLACFLEYGPDNQEFPATNLNIPRLADFLRAARARMGPAIKLSPVTIREPPRSILPVRKLITQKAESYGHRVLFFYAQSWALVHFLVVEQPGAFVEYLKKLTDRGANEVIEDQQEIEDFEIYFGLADSKFDDHFLFTMLQSVVREPSVDHQMPHAR